MRFAGTVLIAHRFSGVTLRVLERLYRDDWGTMASTTDLKLPIDIVKELRIWPHVRAHVQDAADFYELAYVAERTPEGFVIPALRTGDRELGPLINATLGAGVHWDIGEGEVVTLALTGDAIYTRFLNHLFVRQRWGAFGAFTMELLLE
ncbi:MAG: DUF3570 domain-containing protein [Myxococcales bacterium]|nr:DUF3570 domain-containing protein [Myxococcales bacterium]